MRLVGILLILLVVAGLVCLGGLHIPSGVRIGVMGASAVLGLLGARAANGGSNTPTGFAGAVGGGLVMIVAVLTFVGIGASLLIRY